MKKTLLIGLFILLFSQLTLGSWQDKAMKKTNRRVEKINACKCLSKVQEIDGASIKYYFTSQKTQLIHILEKKTINGSTVSIHYYFDKKTQKLLSVHLGTTVFYYQSTGYFAVLSSENFTPDEAKKRAKTFQDLAQKYISKLV